MNIDDYLHDLRARLARSPWTDRQLAEASGSAPDGVRFTVRWVTGFRYGEMDNPQVKTLRALDWALTQADAAVPPVRQAA